MKFILIFQVISLITYFPLLGQSTPKSIVHHKLFSVYNLSGKSEIPVSFKLSKKVSISKIEILYQTKINSIDRVEILLDTTRILYDSTTNFTLDSSVVDPSNKITFNVNIEFSLGTNLTLSLKCKDKVNFNTGVEKNSENFITYDPDKVDKEKDNIWVLKEIRVSTLEKINWISPKEKEESFPSIVIENAVFRIERLPGIRIPEEFPKISMRSLNKLNKQFNFAGAKTRLHIYSDLIHLEGLYNNFFVSNVNCGPVVLGCWGEEHEVDGKFIPISEGFNRAKELKINLHVKPIYTEQQYCMPRIDISFSVPDKLPRILNPNVGKIICNGNDPRGPDFDALELSRSDSIFLTRVATETEIEIEDLSPFTFDIDNSKFKDCYCGVLGGSANFSFAPAKSIYIQNAKCKVIQKEENGKYSLADTVKLLSIDTISTNTGYSLYKGGSKMATSARVISNATLLLSDLEAGNYLISFKDRNNIQRTLFEYPFAIARGGSCEGKEALVIDPQVETLCLSKMRSEDRNASCHEDMVEISFGEWNYILIGMNMSQVNDFDINSTFKVNHETGEFQNKGDDYYPRNFGDANIEGYTSSDVALYSDNHRTELKQMYILKGKKQRKIRVMLERTDLDGKPIYIYYKRFKIESF